MDRGCVSKSYHFDVGDDVIGIERNFVISRGLVIVQCDGRYSGRFIFILLNSETTFLKLKVLHRFENRLILFSALDYNQFKPLENNANDLFSKEKDFKSNVPYGFTVDSPELGAQKSFMYKAGLSYNRRIRKPWLQESPFLFIYDSYQIDLQFKQGVKNIFSSVSNFSQAPRLGMRLALKVLRPFLSCSSLK